jgi:hypothetical protein
MKLSEAMRLGAAKLPQIYHQYQQVTLEGQVEGACAIGLACYAVAPQKKLLVTGDTYRIFPQLADTVQAHLPSHREFEGFLDDLIMYYNDTRKAPPDEIATILAQLGY